MVTQWLARVPSKLRPTALRLLKRRGEGHRRARTRGVPGKLANFTILSDNPLTVPAPKIKDITVWGTVHEGRKLPVQGQASAKVALGPVVNDATFAVMDGASHGQEGQSHEGADVCTLNRLVAVALARGN